MSDPIDFYFDLSSPYGYLASTRIEELAARYGRTVRWRPMLLGVVFKMNGCAPLTEVPLKGQYSVHDFYRTARLHGIPYKHPEKFPLSVQLASRAMLWLEETHGERKAIEFAQVVYRAYFVEGEDITDPDILAALAEGLGVDGDVMIEEANTPAIKDRFRAEVAAAMERGVFGSPFVIVDGEPFWGFDRFYQIEALLKNGRI
jgi:2-hydroxychromene-2-carboxylate isomerase